MQSINRAQRITAGALAALALPLLAAVPGDAAGRARAPKRARTPTAKQIAAAVRRATSSPDLWSTVNICNTAKYPDIIGVRGEMPALGFPAHLFMTVGVQYYSDQVGRFVNTGAADTLDLGTVASGVHQGGVRFPFKPPTTGQTYQLRGVVTFEWRLGNRVIGHAVRHTRHGKPHVDFSDPPGFSAGLCFIRSSPYAQTT